MALKNSPQSQKRQRLVVKMERERGLQGRNNLNIPRFQIPQYKSFSPFPTFIAKSASSLSLQLLARTGNFWWEPFIKFDSELTRRLLFGSQWQIYLHMGSQQHQSNTECIDNSYFICSNQIYSIAYTCEEISQNERNLQK